MLLLLLLLLYVHALLLQLLRALCLLPHLRILELTCGASSFGKGVLLQLPVIQLLSLSIHPMLSWEVHAPLLQVLRFRPPAAALCSSSSSGCSNSEVALNQAELQHLVDAALVSAAALLDSSKDLALVYIHLSEAHCRGISNKNCCSTPGCFCSSNNGSVDTALLQHAALLQKLAAKTTCSSNSSSSRSSSRCCAVVGRSVGDAFENHRLPFRRKARNTSSNSSSSSSNSNPSSSSSSSDVRDKDPAAAAAAAAAWEGLLSPTEQRQLQQSLAALPAAAADGPLLLDGWGGPEMVAAASLI